MPIRLINPPSLPPSELYHHGSITTGTRTVYVAGQVAWDASGDLVSSDLATQVEHCFLNVAAVLTEAGGTFADVARLTVYFVDWTPDKVEPYLKGVTRAAQRLGIEFPSPPLTGIGVAALAEPGVLVEVEAIAVLDD